MNTAKFSLKTFLLWVLAAIVLIFVIAAMKGFQFKHMASQAFTPPPESISTAAAELQSWPNAYTATGTVEADEGITIAAEVQGKVRRIAFKSGERVKAGEVILEQESGNEEAQLNAATARLRLAQTNFERLQQLKVKNTVSQSELDTARQQKESAQGDVDNLKTTLQKKVVRAPFDGRLGIRQVDLGQDLAAGAPIVTLQATNRVRVNFPVPQNWLTKVTKGLPVTIEPGDGSQEVLKTQVTAIGAEINTTTRNATVQAALENDKNRLIPGMAVQVELTLSDPRPVLSVPVTAIIFAPFGDTVYVIEPGEKPGSLKARQQFVRLGKSRGDFIEVLDGIKAGDKVAAAGGFKLFNGQAVVESPVKPPEFKLDPKPSDT